LCVNRHVTILLAWVYCVSTSTARPPHCCVNLKPPSERKKEERGWERRF
jgi:hypothetical protein